MPTFNYPSLRMTAITVFLLASVAILQCEIFTTTKATTRTPTSGSNAVGAHPMIRNESGIIIFQGDIVLTKAQEAEIFNNATQKGKKAFGNLWTDGVTYKFDQYGSGYKMRQAFLSAMRTWERNTCINFTDKITNKTENVLLVSEGDQGGYDGCLSYLGKSQNPQMLFLGRSCQTYGQAAHAIGHTLGLYHTLDREDRDIYVNITMTPEIKKYDDRYREAIKESNNNYGLPFDFGSVMNYRIPFDDTIMMINRRYYEQTLGSPMISFVDLFIVNERYGCKEKCKPESSAKCVNGGFPHPRDCKKCICPGGYGGTLCDKNPDRFGRVFRASKRWKEINVGIFGNGETMPYSTHTHWITSPNGTSITVQLRRISRRIPDAICDRTGVEIKTNDDQRVTGYRFCTADIQTTLKSKSNLVPIILYSNERTTTFMALRYRYESPEASS